MKCHDIPCQLISPRTTWRQNYKRYLNEVQHRKKMLVLIQIFLEVCSCGVIDERSSWFRWWLRTERSTSEQMMAYSVTYYINSHFQLKKISNWPAFETKLHIIDTRLLPFCPTVLFMLICINVFSFPRIYYATRSWLNIFHWHDILIRWSMWEIYRNVCPNVMVSDGCTDSNEIIETFGWNDIRLQNVYEFRKGRMSSDPTLLYCAWHIAHLAL